MKSKLTKFAQVAGIMLALALTLSCSSNDDNGGGGGGGGGNSSGTFSMSPSGELYSALGYYSCRFFNYSDYDVQVTINGKTQTMGRYAPLTGIYTRADYSLSTSANVTVTYSPANKVRYEFESIKGNVDFYNK